MSSSANPPTDELPIGHTISGRYRLCELLDSGGMGSVYRAHDLLLDREVAVKVLKLTDPTRSASRTEEARTLARLAHPSIASVYDAGEIDGRPYIVMELVRGRSLASLLDERGTLSPTEAAWIGAQIADALEASHRLEIVHCDVKPRNVVLAADGTAKLVDFGVSRRIGRDDSGELFGSPHYVAPERLSGRLVDARSDVYSLGAVLYELLTGRPPHVGATEEDTLRMHAELDAVSPRLRNADVPEELATVVLKALARDPQRRHASAEEMARELRSVGGEPVLHSNESTSQLARRAPTTSYLVSAGKGLLPRSRDRALALLAGLVIFLGAIGVVLGSPPDPQPPANQRPLSANPAPAYAADPLLFAETTGTPTPTTTPSPTARPAASTASPTQAPTSTATATATQSTTPTPRLAVSTPTATQKPAPAVRQAAPVEPTPTATQSQVPKPVSEVLKSRPSGKGADGGDDGDQKGKGGGKGDANERGKGGGRGRG